MLTETGNIIENMEYTLYNKINNAIIGKNKENMAYYIGRLKTNRDMDKEASEMYSPNLRMISGRNSIAL